MRDKHEYPDTTDGAARRTSGTPRNLIKTHWRSRGLAVLAAATAVALASFSAASFAHHASPGKRSGSANRGTSSQTDRRRATSASMLPKNNSTQLLNEWTACERTHGDSKQANPTVDAHGVISITIPLGAAPAGDPHNLTGACSGYLADARRAVAGGQPIKGWGNHAKYVEYANCMRANGYPTYPYPSGIEPDGNESTNFNGTGINPESPALLNGHANQTCGKQIGAPAWWINDWGPPGDVVVASGPLPDGFPPRAATAAATPTATPTATPMP